MVDLRVRLDENESASRLLLQVHDELVLEVPDAEVDAMRELVRSTMENVYPLEVPLKVDIQTGTSWEH
jgi:DNA polymerase-1